MKTKPILFSGDMVKALLYGRKTQTRRIVKNRGILPEFRGGKGFENDPSCWGWKDGNTGYHITMLNSLADDPDFNSYCPYDNVDLLWVREAFCHGLPEIGKLPWYYKADEKPEDQGMTRWKPSIHMPRWASRITLEITNIRIERLQDIRDADCYDEGIESWLEDHKNLPVFSDGTPAKYLNIRQAFRALWESVYGEGSWDANPWVWVIEFNTHLINIDEYIREKAA
jgi:hypothetical protein